MDDLTRAVLGQIDPQERRGQQIKFPHGTETKLPWYRYQRFDPSGFTTLEESSI
jgi:hypothetical protein